MSILTLEHRYNRISVMLVISGNSASCLICVVQISVDLWWVLSSRLLLLLVIAKV